MLRFHNEHVTWPKALGLKTHDDKMLRGSVAKVGGVLALVRHCIHGSLQP